MYRGESGGDFYFCSSCNKASVDFDGYALIQMIFNMLAKKNMQGRSV